MLTVVALGTIKGPDGPAYRVVLTDDEIPNIEGVFVLRAEAGGTCRGFEVQSFTVAEASPARPRINALLLRQVPFGRWLAAAVAAASDLREGRDTRIWTVADPRPLARPGTRVVGAPDYDAVARIYRIAVRVADGAAAEEVADAFGISPSHASLWIARAREMGLLGPGAPRDVSDATKRRIDQVVRRPRKKGPP